MGLAPSRTPDSMVCTCSRGVCPVPDRLTVVLCRRNHRFYEQNAKANGPKGTHLYPGRVMSLDAYARPLGSR